MYYVELKIKEIVQKHLNYLYRLSKPNQFTTRQKEKENNLTLGVFYSMENPRLNFWKFPVTNGQFFQIPGKGENLARYIMYIGTFRTFLPEILVSFDFHSGVFG